MIAFFKHALNPKLKGGIESLFEGTGMLATAQSRITLSAALNWLNISTYHDLHLARRIRNIFAHHTEVDGFDDPTVCGLIHSMHKHEQRLYDARELHFLDRRSLSSRELFLARTSLLFSKMLCELVTRRASLAEQIPPEAVLAQGWDSYPPNLANAARKTMAFVLRVIGTKDDQPAPAG